LGLPSSTVTSETLVCPPNGVKPNQAKQEAKNKLKAKGERAKQKAKQKRGSRPGGTKKKSKGY
jgi:hypothetical protein